MAACREAASAAGDSGDGAIITFPFLPSLSLFPLSPSPADEYGVVSATAGGDAEAEAAGEGAEADSGAKAASSNSSSSANAAAASTIAAANGTAVQPSAGGGEFHICRICNQGCDPAEV